MNILYVTNARIPTEKAHGLQIMKTIEAFRKAGESVTLYVPERKNIIKANPFTFYSIESEFEIVRVPNHLGFLERPLHNFYFVIQRFHFGVHAFFYALRKKMDVIYTRDITLAFMLSIFSHKIVVYEDHEPKKSKRWLYRAFLKRIKKKVVVPKNLAILYKEYGVKEDSYVVAPNGVGVGEFERAEAHRHIWHDQFGVPKSNKVILYVGHFYKWKGVYTLLDAAKKFPKDYSVVLIGGTIEDGNVVRQYIDDQKISNVFIHDFLPHETVVVYIRSADVLILPNTSKEERSALYTTPIKLFEYMASGVPVVASNIKSFDGYLKDQVNSILFKPDDQNDLREKVIELLSDTEKMEQISQKAIRDVLPFTWNARVKKILNFLNE